MRRDIAGAPAQPIGARSGPTRELPGNVQMWRLVRNLFPKCLSPQPNALRDQRTRRGQGKRGDKWLCGANATSLGAVTTGALGDRWEWPVQGQGPGEGLRKEGLPGREVPASLLVCVYRSSGLPPQLHWELKSL